MDRPVSEANSKKCIMKSWEWNSVVAYTPKDKQMGWWSAANEGASA
jgi:hypothetical protein